MKYKGIETENYTEAEFLRLPRMGRKSLAEAKSLGARFREFVDTGFDPTKGGVYVRSKVMRERDGDGMFTAIPKVSRPPAIGEPLPVDQYGNVLDGEEMT